MKRITVIVCVVMLLGATGAFAARGGGFAIGGEAGLWFAGSVGGLPTSGMLTIHLPGFPLMLGIGISSSMDLGLTADYWLAHENLASVLAYYAGIGGYLSLELNGPGIAAGGRIPIGLQLWPFGQTFELFVEVAPAVGVSIVPTGFEWHLQGALGFRLWF